MEPDVEALLVRRGVSRRESFIVPIDESVKVWQQFPEIVLCGFTD